MPTHTNKAMVTYGNLEASVIPKIKSQLLNQILGILCPVGQDLILSYDLGDDYATKLAEMFPGTTWSGKTTDFSNSDRETLWTNPNPLSGFASQTISLPKNINDYNIIVLISTHANDDDFKLVEEIYIEQNQNLSYRSSENQVVTNVVGNEIRERAFELIDDRFVVYDSYTTPLGSGTRTKENQRLIPYKIYGIKQISQYKYRRIS